MKTFVTIKVDARVVVEVDAKLTPSGDVDVDDLKTKAWAAFQDTELAADEVVGTDWVNYETERGDFADL